MKGIVEAEAAFLLKRLRKKLSDLSISIRITLFYLVVLISSVVVSNTLYQEIYSNIALKKVSDVSAQTLYSIKANINLLISNINSYSKMILSDNNLQSLLRDGDIYSDLNAQGRVGNYLYKMLQEVPAISSVFIFDGNGNEFSVYNENSYTFLLRSVAEARWYQRVLRQRGAYILLLNGGGAFKQEQDNNFISMIRLIRDINTTEPRGILVMNISEAAFQDAYGNIASNYTTGVVILDENNQSIIQEDEFDKEDIRTLDDTFRDRRQGSAVKWVKGGEYLVSYLAQERYNWKLYSFIPVQGLSNETSSAAYVGFAIILINSLILFVGTILTSRMVTIPIKKLLRSMKGVEKGEFKEVEISAGDNEIGKLRDGYNMMIREIQNLIHRVIEEQRIKRRAELNVLQAQIKPHFLYNTLDSINSLAMLGQTEEVCNIVEALGSYYRISLSKGREVITIGEEIDMVRNYLKIQKIRYGDMFHVCFETDPQCNPYRILKLVLQPLVENALYHGIRAKGENGTITIRSELQGDMVRIVVEDDGVGMTEEDIRMFTEQKAGFGKDGFGLRGTIERLRIFYGLEDIVQIDSRKDCGTRISICVPAVAND